MTATVSRAGFLTTVQDRGRTGYRASGVSVSGALDPHALRIANLLVGNDPSAAGLEVTLGKVRMQFTDDRLVAWCGGAFDAQIGETTLPSGRAGLIRDGEELVIAAPDVGARGWIAISGGIDVPLALGSRATDRRGGFGGFDGRPLHDGDVLELGPQSSRAANMAEQAARAADRKLAGAVRMGEPGNDVRLLENHPGRRLVAVRKIRALDFSQ